MADEATVTCTLTIRKAELEYSSRPNNYRADVTGKKGPVPGAITVAVGGTDVSFTELTEPGLCWMQNLDDTNFVTYGIWEPDTSKFYPLGELLPGEIVVLRLSRDLGEQYSGVGTGTDVANNRLRFRANTAACVVRIEAFER